MESEKSFVPNEKEGYPEAERSMLADLRAR